MLRSILLLFTAMFCLKGSAQVRYTVTYTDSASALIHIKIEPPTPIRDTLSLVMPRSIPGAYSISTYDAFVEQVFAITASGEKIKMLKDENDAPRWICENAQKPIVRVEYAVNLGKMERVLSTSNASVIRHGFVGLLNYSILGWIEGTEKQAVECTVRTFGDWQIFTTNQPTTNLLRGVLNFKTENYYTLADGQIYMGTAFQVKEFKGLVPLFVASYCETGNEYLEDYGTQGINSLKILKDYFDDIPFPHYSIMLLKAVPLEAGNAPQLAMEHLQSSTFFGDTSRTRKAPMRSEILIKSMTSYLHHMAHSYIPMRCYGDNYRPYVLETPAIINNIWFNEGFMWFLAYDALKVDMMYDVFTTHTYHTAAHIQKMNLQYLSQIGSTMYGTDFRIGRAIYARGALMAIDMNKYLLEKSGGKKSMKDVLRYLYNWSKQQNRPFSLEEFPQLINQACDIDLSKIYKKWQLPIK